MRQQVQWPPNQEGSGSPSSNPVILRSPETRQPQPWQPASPSSRKPPTSSESRTPAASLPAQPRSGPRSPAAATKPKMLRTLSKAQTFDQSSQPNKRKGLKATQWSQSKETKAAPETRSGASSRSPNYAPNQIIAGSTSRTNRSISRCPCRLHRNTAFT